MGIELDRAMNTAERRLSEGAIIPFLGVIPAAVKLGLGATQIVSAVAYGIFMTIPSLVTNDVQPLQRSFEYIKHGIGNMIISIPEAVPFLGTLIFLLRGSCKICIDIDQGDKFMPYKSLLGEPEGLIPLALDGLGALIFK